ncbi:MAG: formate transporter FocA [Anaerolineales bacterium]|nr:formate transporter FocA [Anaerolineales bacterium]
MEQARSELTAFDETVVFLDYFKDLPDPRQAGKVIYPLPEVLLLCLLAVLAGAFIALGAIFATTVTAGAADMLPFGIIRLLNGLTFCLGLILVVVAGAELFTGNNLIVMAWADGRVSSALLWRNWAIVYVGNFVGSIATAWLIFYSGQYGFGSGSIGLNILNIANSKVSLDFMQAIALGIMCNALVCLAVWLCYSARSTTDKILSIIFPITAFVAAGFEHSVANMYFIPIGLLVKAGAPAHFWETIGKTAADYPNLTWSNFFIANLLPVTIGNIIGGAVMVGLVYWFVYIRKRQN